MNPLRTNSSLPKPGRSAYGVASAAVLVLIPVIVLVGGDQFQAFLNFGAGVLSLVSLSCSVIWGLFAQDRIFLNTRQRIIGQAVHRTTAVASIAFLLLHITTKIALDHTELIGALIPFSLGVTGIGGLIGLGSLAGLLMIFVGITGALRNHFAAPAEVAARWRAMHMLAYPAWCAALIHGLYAGRLAKPIFFILYGLCLVGVMGALALRSAPRPVKRRLADRINTLLGGSPERSAMDGLEASRARRAEGGGSGRRAEGGGSGRRSEGGGSGGSALPGYESRDRSAGPGTSASPLFDNPAGAESANGFAAAYRAVNTPNPQQPYAGAGAGGGQTASFDMQATEAMPRVDNGGSTSGSWPIPSPPPVGEAPRSVYDPLQDTGFNIPVYGNTGTIPVVGGDVYNTGETNAQYGAYNSNDTYNSGPANEPSPGQSYDSPGSGEPWNTPSGGYR
ncbi:cytochrome b/b6 domain-containing protein [Streptomyces sp. Amel2xC10]|uniref:cytochrome b/b6 domain-containing protein n=1 Tax=Streptomyces sp. Amel2xC10 TaxID=1305826 RepID=UPI000A0872F8|nr:cytochrome b/b6 domain-containing protein [Streptomyces sp. Amel2xC10]SMF02786.1 DMSO/TMAO reductase YedYZ, heme-binding membrane subunit [Streptomyces sp. Amel2xC10]